MTDPVLIEAQARRMWNWLKSPEARAMFRSWSKVFVAAVVSLAATGERDPKALFWAGVCALLPVIYNWIDPSDTRYGRGHEPASGE